MRRALWVVSFAVILVMGLSLLIWFSPGIFVNARSVGWVLELMEDDDLKIAAEELSVSITEPSWSHRTLCLESRSLAVQFQNHDVNIQRPRLCMDYRLLTNWQTAYVGARNVEHRSTAVSEESTQEGDFSGRVYNIYSFLRSLRLQTVELPRIVTGSAKSPIELTVLKGTHNYPRSVFVGMSGLARMQRLEVQTNLLEAGSDAHDFFVTVIGWTGSQRVSHAGMVVRKTAQGEFAYTGTMSYVDIDQRGGVTFEGVGSPRRLQTDFSINWQQRGAVNGTLELDRCHLKATWQSDEFQLIAGDLACDGAAERMSTSKSPISLSLFMPARLPFHFSSRFNLSGLSQASEFNIESALDLDSIRGTVGEVSGTLGLQLSGKLGALAHTLVTATFDLYPRIRSMARLTEALEGTRFAVPAPLNVLNGSIECGIEGTWKFPVQTGSIPLDCKTDLVSKGQQVNVDFDLNIQRRRGRPRLSGIILVHKIKVIAPDLSLTGAMPQLKIDDRISKNAEDSNGPSKSLPFFVDISIRTAEPGAIQIVTNVTKEPIPISINLDVANDEGPVFAGKVRIESFDVEFFKREATIQHFEMTFDSKLKSVPINGLITMDTTEYDYKVDIFGTAERPRYNMYSVPPLPKDQLYAALIFQKNPTELTDTEAEAVDNSDAALASGAVSLLSMYYLASTPVEAIHFNPHTGVVSAKVRLREGVSLEIGSDTGETRTVGLHRRFNRYLTLETMAVNDAETEATTGIAMLRWALRY